MSTFTLDTLMGREFDLLEIAEPWRSAVGRIEQPAYGMVHGPAGSGKSTLLLAFAGHELTRHGDVFYNSSEEGESLTLQNKAVNLGLTSSRLTFGEYRDLDEMKMAAARAGADFIVVDSISDMEASKADLSALKHHCKSEGVGLWIVVQERKDGTFRGPSNLDYDTDIVARVEAGGVLKTSKNRYDTVEDTRVPFTEEQLREMGGTVAAGGQATRENPEIAVRKHTDHGDNTMGRIGKAWTGEMLDVPFQVEKWHIDPERFAERFSLGGVEFGRWMEADDRSLFMAWAAQSFNDFCDLFGLPYTRAGFDGRIKLALGARGKGGRVAAHYEPTPSHTINLTKPRGKGSLAHEYAHALDNMAGIRAGLSNFASGGRSERTDPNRRRLGMNGFLGDLERFFAALYFKTENGGYVEREWARQLHHADTREYYKQRAEVLARSLEKHVRRGLDEKHKGGDYNLWLAKSGGEYLASGVYPLDHIIGGEAGEHLAAFVTSIFDEEIEMRENPRVPSRQSAAGDELADPYSLGAPRENPEVRGTWRRNRKHDGVEVRFPEAPAKHVREQLIAHGFVFASQKEYWFADATEKNVALAKDLAEEAGGGQMDLFGELRENPAGGDLAGFLVQIGTCLELETTDALYQAQGEESIMFTGPEGRMLLICPASRVEHVEDATPHDGASAMFETWHGFEADGDVEIALSGAAWREQGTAERIVYESDKIIRPGDYKGKENTYEHDFDADRRPVYEWGDCLVITELMIDKRGILN